MTILIEIPEVLECLITFSITMTSADYNDTALIEPRWFRCALFAITLLIGIVIGANLPSCSQMFTSGTFESQVRQWAKPYPDDLRDRWAWCYLDSAANWSSDTKLREDVRLKSTQVLTDAERHTLIPLDNKIEDAIPKQRTDLQETYLAVGNGLKVNEWTPPEITTPVPKPEPQPPIRRRIFNRR